MGNGLSIRQACDAAVHNAMTVPVPARCGGGRHSGGFRHGCKRCPRSVGRGADPAGPERHVRADAARCPAATQPAPPLNPGLLLLGLALGSVVRIQRRLAILRQVQIELRKAGGRDGRRGITPDAVGTVVGSACRFQCRPIVARLAPLRPGRWAAGNQSRDAGPKHGPAGAVPPTRRRPGLRPGAMRTLGHVGFRQ